MVITRPQKQEATFGVRAAGFVTLFFFFFNWLVVRQQSYAPGILYLVLHLGQGSNSVEELKDIVMLISLSRNQDPVWRLYHHLIVSPSPPFPD